MTIALLLSAYSAGIISASLLPPLSPNWLLLALFPPLLWLGGKRQRAMTRLLILTLAFTCGVLLYHLDRWPPQYPTHISALATGEEWTIDGRIVDWAARSEQGFSLDIDVLQYGEPRTLHSGQGRMRLYVERGSCTYQPGELIRFQARPRRPFPFGTPGEFDFSRHLAVSAIHVTASIGSPDEIVRIAPPPRSWHTLLERGRTATRHHIDRAVSFELAPLVRSLAIGDRDGLSPQLNDVLARGGVSHLFSISGLHFGLLACALYALLLCGYRLSARLLLWSPPARTLPLCITPLLFFYLVWTGAGFATQRAALMLTALSLLLVLRRHSTALDLLWVAAFGILLIAPLAIFEPSFQLSFAAVAGIVCAHRRYAPLLTECPQWQRWIATLFFSSLAATLATTPLVLWHFHLLAPAGILVNLLAIPLVGWLSVPLAIAGMLCQLIWPDGASLCFQGCAVTIDWMLALATAILRIPGFSGWVYYPSIPLIVSLSLLTAALFISCRHQRTRLALLIVALVFLPWLKPASDRLSVTAFSVGQGESLLVSLSGRQILIDAGGLVSDRFDTGRQLIGPALGRLGIRALDAVIVTHAHPDHAKGMATILRDFPCDLLLLGGSTPTATDLLGVSRAQHIPVRYVQEGWTTLFAEQGGRLSIYRPLAPPSENDASLVVHAVADGQGVLLPGDLEANGIRDLLDLPAPGVVTLLKLPHHGSKNSAPELLLDRFRPHTAFVSVGRDNRFHFPHAEVVSALTERRIPLARTDRDGTLRYVATLEGWRQEQLITRLFH